MRLTIAAFRQFKGIGKESKKYANLPDSYVERATRQIYWKTPRKVQYLPRTVERKRYLFSQHRPWTREFQADNERTKPAPFVHVEPIRDWSFFRGDRVEILVGRDKGKQGFVKQIVDERNWVLVEGLNTKLETVGKTPNFPGILIQKEQPLSVTTDILLVDPVDMVGTKITWKYTKDGTRVRVSDKTGRIIPVPISDKETVDYIDPQAYKEGKKDTLRADVEAVTFKPELKTFDMDIMDKMGIVEDRIPQKYFWY